MTNEFLQDKDYKVPSAPSNYFKFQEGDNRFRVLSSAITGWVYFDDKNKPHRSETPFEGTPKDIKENGRVKHFWAFVCYDYQNEAIKILEITQVSIMEAMKALIDNTKWGNIFHYDLNIGRTGEGLETKYTVQPEPPIGEPSAEILEKYAMTKIDLQKLYTGENPFLD
jgi:hypothetical protein